MRKIFYSVRKLITETMKDHPERKDHYRKERMYGAFHQVISLPTEVDESQVEAQFKKGALTVKLAKTSEAQSQRKRITVKGE